MATWMNPDTNTPYNYGSGSSLVPGIGQIASGVFGNSGAPYKAGFDQLQNYYGQAEQKQNPFYNAGTSAIPKFQDWLSKQQDPAQFINSLMSQYQTSPYQNFLQQQGQRELTNQASASGLIGSTPYQQAGVDYAQQMSQRGLNDWLSQVLGINTQYGAGQQSLIGTGQSAANSLSQLLAQLGQGAEADIYGQKKGEGSDFGNILGGIGSLAGLFF